MVKKVTTVLATTALFLPGAVSAQDKSVQPLPSDVKAVLQAMSSQLREAKSAVVHAAHPGR